MRELVKICEIGGHILDPFARATDDGDMPAPKPKSSTRKYVCPVCGAIIRATKGVNVICGDCDVAFEPAC